MEKTKWYKECFVRSLTIISLTVLAIASFGCAGATSDTEDPPGLDAGPDAVVTPDAPPPVEARLSLTLVGLPGGNDVRVATNDAKVVCFTAKAVGTALTTERLQFEITSNLYVDNQSQYSDWKLQNDAGDVLGAALPTASGPDTLTLAVTVPISLPAEVDREFCLSVDIANEDLLSGRTFTVKLLPFDDGDVSRMDNNTDLPIDHIDGADTIRTDLLIVGISGPSVPRSPPQMGPTEQLPVGYLTALSGQLTPPTDIVVHSATVTAPAEYDIVIKMLSYSLRLTYLGDPAPPEETTIANASLSLHGQPISPGTWNVQVGGGDCNFPATWRLRCVQVNLDEPIIVHASTTVTIDLHVVVSGRLVNNEIFTTESVMDFYGPQEGPLSRRVIGRGAINKGAIWGNDGLWWFNGYTVHWGSRYQPTFVIRVP